MNDEHLNILKQGKVKWNEWMQGRWKEQPTIEMRSDKVLRRTKVTPLPSMDADLSGYDLTDFKDLRGFNFRKVDFSYCNLRGIDFTGSIFRKGNLSNADIRDAKLDGTDCEYANFIKADLSNSSFKKVNLKSAKLSNTSLFKTNFTNSTLVGCNLMWAKIIETNFHGSHLSNVKVYGASIWNSLLENTIQSNIIITKKGEFEISVDNLEIAQFLYLITTNSKIKTIIETLNSKIVLILGRFSPERKLVLDKVKEKLATLNYVPVIFDFQKPSTKDFIEPILLIAQLARFVIADFTDPKIVLEEVPIVARNTSTVIIPILKSGQSEPVTLNNLRANSRSISKTFIYRDVESLVSKQLATIINTANKLSGQLYKRF